MNPEQFQGPSLDLLVVSAVWTVPPLLSLNGQLILQRPYSIGQWHLNDQCLRVQTIIEF